MDAAATRDRSIESGQPLRIGMQLHTLRDLDATLPETIRRVGEAGFDGVEFAGTLADVDPAAVADALAEAGIEPIAAHVGMADLETELDAIVRRYDAIDCRRLVVPHLGPDWFVTERTVRDAADRLGRLGGRLADQDVQFYYHNAVYDLKPLFADRGVGAVLGLAPVASRIGSYATAVLDAVASPSLAEFPDRTGLGRLSQRTLGRSVRFEVDTGAVAAAGFPQGAIIDFLGDRVDMVHLTADVDRTAVLEAARRNGVEWIVFEDDHPEDPETTLRQAANGLLG